MSIGNLYILAIKSSEDLNNTYYTGCIYCYNCEIDKTPLQIISDLEDTIEGKTKPGQSHNMISLLRYIV